MSLATTLAQAVFPMRCGVCGLLAPTALCNSCAGQLDPLDEGPALYHYSLVAGEMVRRLKYLRITPLARPMADLLAERYEAELSGFYDAVVPVPIHWTRRFWRGFNQSELLCESFPTGLVQKGWLKRLKRTKPQARLTPDQRLTSLLGAFAASRVVAGKRILLIDDVVTSGGTFNACRAALLEKGATRVDILAFAGSGDLRLS